MVVIGLEPGRKPGGTTLDESSGKALPAPACTGGVGVGDREPGLVEPVLVVQRGPFEQLRRCRVDHDLDVVQIRRCLVVGVDVAVEEHLVREPTATARPDRDTERELTCALGLEQFLDLADGGVGERDHQCCLSLTIALMIRTTRCPPTARCWRSAAARAASARARAPSTSLPPWRRGGSPSACSTPTSGDSRC